MLKLITRSSYLNYAKESLQTFNISPNKIFKLEGKREHGWLAPLYGCPMRSE